jgi:hypothetical protein
MVTVLKNAGYEKLIDDIKQDMEYKNDFINCLLNEKCYHYPNKEVNGYYGYMIEEIGDNNYYLRHYKPC